MTRSHQPHYNTTSPTDVDPHTNRTDLWRRRRELRQIAIQNALRTRQRDLRVCVKNARRLWRGRCRKSFAMKSISREGRPWSSEREATPIISWSGYKKQLHTDTTARCGNAVGLKVKGVDLVPSSGKRVYCKHFLLCFFFFTLPRCCVSSYKWIGSLFKSKCYEQQNTVVLYLIDFCHTMNMYIYFFSFNQVQANSSLSCYKVGQYKNNQML